MKKRMLSFCLAFMLIISALPMTVSADVGVSINIDENFFPDPVFRSYVSKYLDLNGDLLLSEYEREKVTSIDLSKTAVADLTGIERFSSTLVSLNVSGCTDLTSINVSGAGITIGRPNSSAYNQLTNINASGCTQLKSLACRFNRLNSLNVSGCIALTSLNCGSNQLSSLDISSCTQLTGLDCSNNRLSSLDVSKCTRLANLICDINQLSSLDINKCTQLQNLSCAYNHLTTLDRQLPLGGGVIKVLTTQAKSQTSNLEIQKTSNGWTADLSKLVGTENLNKVELKVGQNWQYNTATGLASYTGEGTPSELVYYYNGNSINLKTAMDVTVTLSTKQNVVMKQGAEKAYVNGIVAPTTQYASGYAKMENISGTMQLPLRYIAEVNGFTVNYDESTGKTRVTNQEDGTYLLITPNSTTVTKHTADGTQVGSSDTPLAFSIKNGVTMGPLRFTCEALGLAVSYQETSHGVYVVVSKTAQTSESVVAQIEEAYQLGL